MSQKTPEEILDSPNETITLAGFVLDKSGSMGPFRDEAIEGTNEYITELQQKSGVQIFFTLVMFDTEHHIKYDNVRVKEVSNITEDDYIPGGMTALNDAIGNMMARLRQAGEKLKREGYDVKYIVTINTDGHENASSEYKNIAQDIKSAQDEGNWTFLFLGADIDSFAMARAYNLKTSSAVSYGKAKTKGVFRAAGAGVHAFANSAETMTTSLAVDNAIAFAAAGGQTTADDPGTQNADGTRTVGEYQQEGQRYTKSTT